MERGEHLPHDVAPLNAELIELRERLDGLFFESDREIAHILFRIMQDE